MELNVNRRENTGKEAARQYRKSGKIPGIVYGNKIEPCAILVDQKNLFDFIKQNGTSQMLTVSIEGDKRLVLFKEIDRHVLKDTFVHVDFQEIDQNKEIVRTVAIQLVGSAPGVVTGGILLTMAREIEVKCFPKDIPEKPIEISVSALELNDTLHASDIILPPELKLVSMADLPIVTVTVPKAEEVKPVEAAVEGAEGEAAAAATTPEASSEDKKEPEIVGKKGKKEKEEE